MSARTVQALRFLGLVDDDGHTTDDLEWIRRAHEQELPAVLAKILRRAYAAVFARVDPATSTDRDMNEAFRAHEPSAQRPKMIALFRALCVRAGLIAHGSGGLSAAAGTPPRKTRAPDNSRSSYPLVRGLLEALPPDGHWTSDERERWTNALLALLDLSVRVDDEPGSVDR